MQQLRRSARVARLGNAQIVNRNAAPSIRCAARTRTFKPRYLLRDSGLDVAANLFIHATVEADRGHRADNHRQHDSPLEAPPTAMDGSRENGNYPSLEFTSCRTLRGFGHSAAHAKNLGRMPTFARFFAALRMTRNRRITVCLPEPTTQFARGQRQQC